MGYFGRLSGACRRGFLLVFFLTQRKETEQALRLSEQRLDLALSTINEGVWDWRVDTGEVYYNRVWYTMLGYEDHELPEEFATWRRLVHPDDLERAEQVVQHHLALAEPFDMEVRMRTRQGDWRWIRARGSVVEQDAAGRAVRMLGTHMDVTDLKRAREGMLRAKEKAETADRAKSEFLANMSHEIRTPLNGIQGMLQLMHMTELDEESRGYVVTALTCCQRLTRLLRDILDLSRIEAGRLSIITEPFDLRDMVDSVEKLFLPSARQAGLELAAHVDERVPETLLGDGSRLQQVLNNLVGNAIKFTEAGHVRLEVHPLPGPEDGVCRLLFEVSDTGIGIPEDQLETLFEPFVQLDRGFARKYGGAGLGLSITKKLLDLMGGDITVASQPGKGTAFQFSVPLGAVAARPAASPRPCRGGIDATDGLRVLVVEDDPVNQFAVTRLAGSLGCAVSTADDGSQALDLLRVGSFDVVLMDIQMPVMDGIETTRRIREGEAGLDTVATPIIALTAFAMDGDRERFLAEGMNDYLSKPVDVEALRCAIVRALEPEP